jgi:hypothetical protein
MNETRRLEENCPDRSVICDGHQELRDIVIETRRDVKHIRTTIDQLSTCLHEHEAKIGKVEVDVGKLQKGCESHEKVDVAKQNWTDSVYTKVGIASGIVISLVLGIAGLFKS